MKIKYLLFGVVAALVCACSSDDDTSTAYTFEERAAAPVWSVDLTGNDAAPSWTAPAPTKFESSMFIMVKLQEELARYSTEDDLMTVFIGDECRAVPAVSNTDEDGNVTFVLKIRGNSTDREVNFTLCYYCAQLHQIFSVEGQETFVSERTYGVDEDLVVPLLKGCQKYPVQQELTVNLPANVPFTPAEGDIIGAFVGNECRGVGKAGVPFTVFCTSADEMVQLRYYSAQKGGVYSLTESVVPNNGTITLAF